MTIVQRSIIALLGAVLLAVASIAAVSAGAAGPAATRADGTGTSGETHWG